MNNKVWGRDGTAGYKNTTTHPTCILQPPDRQNYVHDPAMSGVIQRRETNTRYLTWPGVTQAGEFNTEIRDTHRPRLFDDRPRFQNIKERPMFFPTNPEWFLLGSYDAPLVRDARKLAPLVEWSSPPMGMLGADGERMPCDTTGHNLPVVTSAATRRLGKTYVVNTYEGATCDSVPLWINPPAVIQIQLQETGGTRRARSPDNDVEEDLRNAALRSRGASKEPDRWDLLIIAARRTYKM